MSWHNTKMNSILYNISNIILFFILFHLYNIGKGFFHQNQ